MDDTKLGPAPGHCATFVIYLDLVDIHFSSSLQRRRMEPIEPTAINKRAIRTILRLSSLIIYSGHPFYQVMGDSDKSATLEHAKLFLGLVDV